LSAIELRAARKTFPNGVEALRGVDLDVADGELMVLVGPSGCGKTTALRAIAGLERLSSGEVRIGGDDVGDLEPADRDVAMVFQNYALYPNMTVARNISFGLRARGASKEVQERRVREIAKVLDIEALLDRKPRALSGGQRQRVAMGRAIVRDPRAFLMDEPLSNLDARLRVQMRGEIVRIQAELSTTTVYVTHDQVEAMTMGQRVTVMEGGRVLQCDSPQRIYDRPANSFVARFMGSPPMSLLLGRLAQAGGGLRCEVGETSFEIASDVLGRRPALAGYTGREVVLGVRPDGFQLGEPGADGGLGGTVQLAEMLGSEVLVHVDVAAQRPTSAVAGPPPVGVEHNGGARMTGRFDRDVSAQAGDPVAVLIDPAQLDFFDPETGDALPRDGQAVEPGGPAGRGAAA
jgi:multiple sugar transport system ATP-binding protein